MTPTPAEPQRQAPSTGPERPPFRAKVELLATLGKSLHEVGLPAHLLEDALSETAARFAVPVQAFSMPTGLWMWIDDGEAAPATVMLRVDPGQVHLERLDKLETITGQLSHGTLSPADAKRRIDELMNAPPRWGKLATVLAYLLSAAAFSVFFGGGMQEVVTGMCVGLAVGCLSIVFQHRRASRRMFELTAATAAAAIANAAHTAGDSLVDWIPLAAGLIILLPGLALVDAIEELAHGHLTSGSARLAGVGVVLLALTFGTVLGLTLVPLGALEPPTQVVDPMPGWFLAPALVAVAVGSTIRFRGRAADIGIILVASTIALVGSRLGKAWLGEFAGPFVAALVLGLSANVFSRAFKRPAQMFTLPGLALLVPGSFGVQSMSALLNEHTLLGVDTAFHMVLAAMALVTGLLVSNAMMRERAW
jgi:uncharacterized membrane protein YjjP (DUF1212 family)